MSIKRSRPAIILSVILIGGLALWLVYMAIRPGDPNLIGTWARISPPPDAQVGTNTGGANYDPVCAAIAPRRLFFFSDGIYASDGTVFAGGQYAVPEHNVLRWQAADGGLRVTRYGVTRYAAKGHKGRLVLNFLEDLDPWCSAEYQYTSTANIE